MRLWPLLLLLACTSMPPTGHPLTPVTSPAGPSAPPAPVQPRGPQGDGSAFEDERNDEVDTPPREPTQDDKLARMAEFTRTAPVPPVAPAQGAGPALPTVAAPMWDPSRPLPQTSFGVRVLGVLLDLDPPRAVLGLPDGREQVVTPGAMLPTEGVVVLAIGRNAVQIARITPQGFYARVETETVQALSTVGP